MAGALTLREGVGRQVDYWKTVTLRTWRGSVVSSFVAPLFYVLAMGVLLGGFIDGDPDRLEGATSYLAFLVPGLVAAHAMQTAVAETSYPVMGNLKWNRVYESMIATPLTVRDVVAAHLGFVAVRVAVSVGVFDLVVAPFGVFESWWGPFVAFAAQVLTGMAFATLTFGFACRVESEAAFGVLFRIGVFPLFLFSGAFFPVSNLGDVGAWAARLTPLWQGVSLSRMFSLDHIDWTTAAINTVVLVVLCAIGWRWSVSGLEKRMAT
ncbi:ABC transporter permease [Nocardioides sp. GXZ039]|uniref:ABC transporter permease n=1 Tax=Nocardioides sp. GXZ039 TaxID=3136018 RepID=UPI0030F37790